MEELFPYQPAWPVIYLLRAYHNIKPPVLLKQPRNINARFVDFILQERSEDGLMAGFFFSDMLQIASQNSGIASSSEPVLQILI